jgi:hypothetical protein
VVILHGFFPQGSAFLTAQHKTRNRPAFPFVFRAPLSAALSEAYGADVTLQKHGTQYELRLAAHSVAGDSVFSLPVSNS